MKTTDFNRGDRFKINSKAYPRDRFEVIAVSPEEIRCDVFNGNGVLAYEMTFDQRSLDYKGDTIQFLERMKKAA